MNRSARAAPLVVAAASTLAVAVAFGSMLIRQRSLEVWYELFLFHNGPSAVVSAWMGVLVLRRRPGHGAGRVLLAIGAVGAAHTAVAALADSRLVAAGITSPMMAASRQLVPADLPLDASIPLWVMNWLWVPAPVLAVTVLPLVFPDGRLPGRRWRPVVAVAATGTGLLVAAFVVDAWPSATWADTPLASGLMIAAGGLAVAAAAVAGCTALAGRWRAAGAVQRRQFRPVGVAAGLLALVGIATYPWQPVWIPAVLVAFNSLLVAYALAAARYRLHDLEPVLGRAAVAATVSLFVAAVYAGVVVGVGAFVGRRAESHVLPIVAVAAVVPLIEPIRRGARRLVDRVLYRADADRGELLAQLAARASRSPTSDDVVAEVTELLVRSTGAARAETWLDTGAGPQLAAAAGASDEPDPVLRADVDDHTGRLGELRLYARAAADLVPDARRLLVDVAHALGIVVRNGRLAARLNAQLAELQASRQRLVEAHDRARRSLERDIHDGTQARLIGLRLRVGVARARLTGDHPVVTDLDALGAEIDAAVRSLRELARGLHPPILEQSGAAAALRAYVRDLPIPVTVLDTGATRYPPPIEAAAYFTCLEAIQNALRHAQATAIRVELHGEPACLRFRVHDDGIGFDPAADRDGTGLANIDDRVSALGGRVRVRSAPAAGTQVGGEIPAQPLVDDR